MCGMCVVVCGVECVCLFCICSMYGLCGMCVVLDSMCGVCEWYMICMLYVVCVYCVWYVCGWVWYYLWVYGVCVYMGYV